ncbi:MAG: hypothetical protein OXE50_15550 [Chloroflexi bacterium]|nr:hypothetical protein [Chloroflexota bacterium]
MINPTDDDSGFIADTVRATGMSPATIRRSLRIGNGIIPELLDSLADTPIRNREADLLYLSFMTPSEQLEVLRLLREALSARTTLSDVLDAAGPATPLPTQLQLMQRIWRHTSETERQEFLSWLAREEGH